MPRLEATRERIDRFRQRLGQVFRSQGRLYLVGGSLMVFADVSLPLEHTMQESRCAQGTRATLQDCPFQGAQRLSRLSSAARPAPRRALFFRGRQTLRYVLRSSPLCAIGPLRGKMQNSQRPTRRPPQHH